MADTQPERQPLLVASAGSSRRQSSSTIRASVVIDPATQPVQSPQHSPTTSSHISFTRTSPHFGPLAAPTSPEWRRRRLLGIGNEGGGTLSRASTQESSGLVGDDMYASYGSTGGHSRSRAWRKGRSQSRNATDHAATSGNEYFSDHGPERPVSPLSRIQSRSSAFFGQFRRPLSAYDAVGGFDVNTDHPEEEGARVNGVRVWYSSFTSIDWLHDAIKDSSRLLRLRKKRTSFRGKVRNFADRSIGWIIVTVVGFLVAVIAFLVVRSEQLLFDLKEGYCQGAWWKAKRFCCPGSVKLVPFQTFVTFKPPVEITCDEWRTWSDVIGPRVGPGGPQVGDENWVIEYASYTVIALALAITSSILTIKLTASTNFVTRKDSGVLGPSFNPNSNETKEPVAQGGAPRKVLYFASGSGIPEIKTILSGFVIHGYLGGVTLFTKSVGLALSVASGLSLGKEGPFVHIACCVGNIVSRFFRKYENNEGKRREVLSAAAAAGVAVAFGAPIGGVLFSLEEVSYFFPPKVMWRSFWCAMIAAVTLRFLDPFGTGKLVLFQVTYDEDWHAFELVPFLFLGVFGGLYGAYFSKLNFRWSRDVRNGTWLKTHPVSEVIIVTLVTSALCFLNLYTRMGGTELVYYLLAECRPGDYHEGLCISPESNNPGPIVSAIALALVVKGALTIVTFGIKLPAGIFIPSLGVGACMGRIVGIGMQWLQWNYPHWGIFESCGDETRCVIPGIYAMVGAAATLSGVTRTTVSLAVIMFELTKSLSYVVPIMLAVLVGKTVADAIEPKGIYDLVITLAQLPYLDHKQEYLWGAYQITDIVWAMLGLFLTTDKSVAIIHSDQENTVKTLRDKLQVAVSTGIVEGFPLITSDRKLVGYIGTNELEHALAQVADDPDAECHFTPAFNRRRSFDAASFSSSFNEDGTLLNDPFDFSLYMDRAPLSVPSHAPLALVQQMFVKLGARYIIVTDANGAYVGVIDKKTWIAFLGELEEEKHS
ncbi:hypothetical protein FS837_006172 [Tulasnella sp. UAMH 9824]|nr:hypothetical protein FS837_006172 [Tulasnella sp. UAMH 9824]